MSQLPILCINRGFIGSQLELLYEVYLRGVWIGTPMFWLLAFLYFYNLTKFLKSIFIFSKHFQNLQKELKAKSYLK